MKIKVNDVELDLAPGTSAIDAVFAAGYDVPYFCSQEYMSPIGACRMCIARIGAPRKDRATGEWILDEETGEPKIFWFPNLMATCTTSVMEGMVVDTASERVKKAQNGMIEFTLINHPLDCPTCDKGGACELQDRSYEYGTGVSRFEFDKRHTEKHAPLSDLITLDRERCIHCKRCVRYFEEVPGDEVLDFIERGGHTYIGSIEEGLPSNFTGNITDICPVGALLDTTARFRGRNWEYDHTPTTSLDDASGSAIVVDARTGRIERIKAGIHPQINKSWIDDGTRFGHEYVDHPDRIRAPLLRQGGELVEATWEEAAARIAAGLRGLEADELIVALRADATLEEGVAARALAGRFRSGRLDHAPRPAGGVIPPLPSATFEDLATADAILVMGDPTEEVPIADLRIKDALKGVTPPELMAHGVPIADLRLKERMPRKREILAVLAPYRTDLMKHAGRAGTHPVGGEAAALRALTDVANGRQVDDGALAATGLAPDAARAFVDRLKSAESPVVVVGALALADPAAAAAAWSLCKAVRAKPMPLGPMANSRGLEAIGVLPDAEDHAFGRGLDAPDAAGAKAMIVSGLDPAADERLRAGLEGLELLVAHASFPNATTALADVVLPAKTGYEKEGAVVNLEGRALPVRPAPVDSGSSEDLTGVVKRIGEALGERLDGRSVRSARRVLRKELDLDLHELDAEGAMLAGRGRARGAARADKGGGSREGAAPAALLAPSMVRPEFVDRNPHLLAATGGALLRLHPEDAAERGVKRDDVVSVVVEGVRRRARVTVDEGAPRGTAVLPSLPERAAGPAAIDWATLQVERSALEVA